jgi:hypothetical protein
MNEQRREAGGGVPGLGSLEFMGALSARLAHSLSNHLAIISGNLQFLKATTGAGAGTALSALEAAIQASERAGELLGRFTDLRRSAPGPHPVESLMALCAGLRAELVSRPGWHLELDPALSAGEDLASTVPTRWLCYALVAILQGITTDGGSVLVTLSPAPPRTNRAPLWPLAEPPAAFLLLTVRYASGTAFSWEDVRSRFSDWSLVAVYELVRDAGGVLDAQTLPGGQQQVLLALPLLKPD